MTDTALTPYHFTIDKAIAEWLEQKRIRTSSQRTYEAYRETMQSFRLVISRGNIDLLDNPTDIERLATIWANTRNGKTRRPGEDVSPSTYNQRLAILSSFYTFLQKVYKLDIPNPIKRIKKRPVQAYAAALPIAPETVEEGLERINRATLQGMRDYALLAVALATGRRARELVTLRFEHMKITGSKHKQRVTLTFAHCKDNKQMRDKLDVETSAVLLEYLAAQHGEDLLHMPGETPLWLSYSRQNKGAAISTKTLANICARYLDTSKVHTLRHTFAVGMMKSGAPITDLAARLGHTDIKITHTYAKELMGDENPYGEKLTARFGIKRKR
jgi:integrase